MSRSTRAITIGVAFFSFAFLMIPYLFLLHYKAIPPLDDIFTEPQTNITLRISGRCRKPFTYIGVDTRKHLLKYYDLSGTPIAKYSPPKMNWARAALLQYAFNKCQGVKWLVYTDSDAYIPSRDAMGQKLYKLAPHVVYQHGMWSLNSGISAWHMTSQGREVLADWLRRYTPTRDFFAEQRAMLHAVHRYQKVTKGFPNGFIGWHIKGSALQKTEVANMGRMLCYYENTMAWILLIPLWIITIIAVFIIIRVRVTARVAGVKPFVQLAVMVGRLLRSDVFILLSSTLMLLPVLINKTGVLGQWQLHTLKNLSHLNLTHILPNGKLMIQGDRFCSGGWCIAPVKTALSGSLHRMLVRMSRSRILTVSMFLAYGILTNVLPRVTVAFLCAVWLVSAVAIVCRAVNIGNIFIMHDVADGLFRRRRLLGGKWALSAVAPSVNSGTLEVVSPSTNT